MNKEQLDKASKNTTELMVYLHETEKIKYFIDIVSENKLIRLVGINSKEMWGNGDVVYELVGEEIIDLLKTKLAERESYLDNLSANDLIT
jgi:hypothetical protein